MLTPPLLSKVCLEDEGLPLSLGHPPSPPDPYHLLTCLAKRSGPGSISGGDGAADHTRDIGVHVSARSPGEETEAKDGGGRNASF